MGSQEEYKAMRRQKTKEAAMALVDDLEFFRRILNEATAVSAGDIRRMSAQLRRILVDGVLEKVAGPRIGKVFLPTPNISAVLASNKNNPFPFVGIGHVQLLGIYCALVMLERSSRPREIKDYNPEARILVSPEHFMKQGVMIFEGQWITRREVIRFIANVAEGVHSGEVKDERERLIQRARALSTMSLEHGVPTFKSNLSPFSSVQLPPMVDRSQIDWALVEVWAAASHLCASENVKELEAYISREL